MSLTKCTVDLAVSLTRTFTKSLHWEKEQIRWRMLPGFRLFTESHSLDRTVSDANQLSIFWVLYIFFILKNKKTNIGLTKGNRM